MKIRNHSITVDEYIINSHLQSHMTVDKLSEIDKEKLRELLDEKDQEEKHEILRRIQNEDYKIGDLLNVSEYGGEVWVKSH